MSGSPVLFVLGTSHAVAPALLRERFQVDLDEVHADLLPLIERGWLGEAIPLATCGRLELHGASTDPRRVLKSMRERLADRSALSLEAVRAHTYVHHGRAAIRHLFRVAAGLDSIVHGEAQIIGQVRSALECAAERGTAGPVLQRAFQSALATGKLVRTRTAIGRGAVSVAGASIALLQREIGSLEPLSAVVLGAGDTGSLVARLLRKAGIGRLTIVNRTLERARKLAAGLDADSRPVADLDAVVAAADIVVGTMGNSAGLLGGESVRIVARHDRRARYFLDLAQPRNFDPGLATVPGIRLIDLDHVFRSVASAQRERTAQIPLAEAIVDEAADEYMKWLRNRGAVPVIRAMRARVLELAAAEAERHARGLGDEERARMLAFARSLARTLLHQPTAALRDAQAHLAEGQTLLDSAAILFGVPGGSAEARRSV